MFNLLVIWKLQSIGSFPLTEMDIFDMNDLILRLYFSLVKLYL